MVSKLLDESEIDQAAIAGFQFAWNAALKEAAKVAPNAEMILKMRYTAISARPEPFQDILNERLAAIVSLTDRGSWLPIEQYFKDVPSGRVLLGWDDRGKRMPTKALGYYDFIGGEWRHGVTSIGVDKDAYHSPTHYMVLPDDPVTKG